MPPEGVKWKPHENILTFEEILRLVKIMAALGIKNIKITGGEPLLRKGAHSFLKDLKLINGIEKVRLTTNGLLLNNFLNEAEENALPNAVNISLDALDINRYKQITGFNNGSSDVFSEPKVILSVIDRLLEKQITVKINCVPIHSINEEEIIPITKLGKEKNIIVRFIELMPIGCASALQCISGTQVKEIIEKTFGALVPFDNISGSGPAVYYSLNGFKGKIGFINALSHSFCHTCNRLRLTSDGFLKLCLSSDVGLDLRQLLRNGANDSEVSQAIIKAVKNKPSSYKFSENIEGMFKIGG